MPDVRPIDATALQNTISEWRKKEMENDNSITGSAIIDAFGDVLDAISVAPTIDIDPRWVSVKDRLPDFRSAESTVLPSFHSMWIVLSLDSVQSSYHSKTLTSLNIFLNAGVPSGTPAVS